MWLSLQGKTKRSLPYITCQRQRKAPFCSRTCQKVYNEQLYKENKVVLAHSQGELTPLFQG